MTTGWEKIEGTLNEVSKPGRYIGGEYNIQVKEWGAVDLRVALAFPDIYEIGLSHLGLRILYELINSEPKLLAERVYAPWPDFQKLLKNKGVSLYTLENKRSLADFDVIGFSLQYELSYTNVLSMLDLGGIPIFSKDRGEQDPLVIGGGPNVFNPEPLADFFDLFLIGEAEEVIIPVLNKIKDCRQAGMSKESILLELEQITGVYIPSHFEVSYQENGAIAEIRSRTGNQPTRAVVKDFSQVFFPKKWIVPYLDIVHDRVVCEIQRGCSRGCRFCQAGMIYRPVREKDPGAVMQSLRDLVANTGYEELSLTSLSSADYSKIEKLLTDACGCFTPMRVNVSLPSLRIDSFSVDLASKFQGNRKGSLTFAPEAGTDRLRRVINKGVTEDDLLTASTAAFQLGWQKLKLYFMIGLPTETETDLAGIADLVQKVIGLGYKFHPRTNALRVTVSASTFVPKAHTPFQWRRQISVAETVAKQQFLKDRIRGKHLEFDWHEPVTSRLEGIMARGDRRLGRVIWQAWQKGAQFDSWSEHFQPEIWWEVFRENGLDPDFYTRERDYQEILPWSHINSGVSTAFLRSEDQKAEEGLLTEDCRDRACFNCGVCSGLNVSPRMAGE